ncbi:MAG: hypothetical protein NTV05_03580 [Acidobacteria bacterium]|nr:hypothetical protein [Acidobacteriota bacterium]
MPMTPRTYDLYLTPIFKVWLGLFVIFSLAVPATLLVSASEPDGPPVFVSAMFIGAVTIAWLFMLAVPHRIVVSDDGRITFVAVLRRRTLAATDVVAVRPHSFQFGFLVVKGSGRKVVIPNQFTGFHLLLRDLAEVNQAIEILGLPTPSFR